MKRLFVAVDVDENARAQIAAIAAAARRACSGLRRQPRVSWVHVDRLHLTLEFLGEVDEAAERRARSALAEPFAVAPFSLQFAGLGLFPSIGPPRVLWLGIGDGSSQLCAIQAELRRRVRGSEGRGEEFKPHLTLARFRDRVSRPDLREIVELDASAGPCRIDRVTLYESHLSPKGPTHIGLAEGPLRPCTSAPLPP